MSVDGLQTIVVTDDDIFTIALGLIFHDSDLTAESSTDGVTYIDLDVETLMLTSPTGTEIRGDDTTWGRHAETTQVDTEGIGQGGLAMSINVVPVFVEVS